VEVKVMEEEVEVVVKLVETMLLMMLLGMGLNESSACEHLESSVRTVFTSNSFLFRN
jgi:hypothetical protein